MEHILNYIFGTDYKEAFRDPCFWFLLLSINISGNPGFTFFFNEVISSIILFVLLAALTIVRQINIEKILPLTITFVLILFIQAIYLEHYSVSSSLNTFIKISCGGLLILNIGDRFSDYFVRIIRFYAIISLVCFTLNCLGNVIPYYQIEETKLDGGRIIRVYNIIYTQIYSEGVLTLRNCGPFWEPGAYQGFLNLALFCLLFSYSSLTRENIITAVIFIISILTTTSTGGYVTLTFIIFMYLLTRDFQSSANKFLLLLTFLVISVYLFSTMDFLGEKIVEDSVSDSGRISFNLSGLESIPLLFFGYGYDSTSLTESSINAVGALFLLLKYTGVCGFIAFLAKAFFNNCQYRISYFILIVLIMLNEPFLTAGVFWWGVLFVDFSEIKNTNIIIYSN